jgi:hypothetical protein
MTGKRTDSQPSILLTNVCEIGQAIDIHQVRRLRQAQIQEWDQALTTGEYLGVIRVDV